MDEKWYHWQVKDIEWTRPDEDKLELDIELPHGAKLSATGLVLPKVEDEDDELDEKQWRDIGTKLIEIDSGVQWAYGDWWDFGHKYGKRAALVAREVFPYEFGSLMNLGWVARKVPTSLRNEALTFAHHVAVAKLHPHAELQKDWLEKAASREWTAKELEKKIRDQEKVNKASHDEALKKHNPEEYNAKKAHQAAIEAIYQFEKIVKENQNLEWSIQTFTDEQVLMHLAYEIIIKAVAAVRSVRDMSDDVLKILTKHQEKRAAARDFDEVKKTDATDEDEGDDHEGPTNKSATKRRVTHRERLPESSKRAKKRADRKAA